MLKIALEIKKEVQDVVINDLKKRNYRVDTSSFNTNWIYDLINIRYGKDSLVLENGNLISYNIKLDDLDYFEIHNQTENN